MVELDVVRHGITGYARSRLLQHPSTYQVSQWWTLHGRWRSLQWKGTRAILKSRDPFDGHPRDRDFLELIRESESYGAERPSSYPGIWWSAKDRPRLPHVRPLWRRYGLVQVAGAWQRAFLSGSLTGSWVHYDIRSAYLWAMSLGLPDPGTYRWVRPRYHAASNDVVWLVTALPAPGAPYPYNNGGDLLATEEEMGKYGLSVTTVHGGISYSSGPMGFDMTPVCDSILRYSCWKQMARSWWGQLASRTGARVHYASGGVRDLPPHRTDPVWAHLILGRVRMRLWEIVRQWPRDVARVYVDSIICRAHVPVPIGERIGDWREEGRWNTLDGPALYIRNAVMLK